MPGDGRDGGKPVDDEDFSEEEIKDLMRRYVRSSREPVLHVFVYKYDEIIEELNVDATDVEERKRLLSATEKRVREFRERYKN